MNTLLKALLMATLFSTQAIAGGSHSHGKDGSHMVGAVSSEKIMTIAAKKVNQLAKTEKILASWSNTKADKAIQKNFGHDDEWVITFNNPKVEDQAKQTLYLFFTLDGHYIAANYTGN